MLPVSRSSWGKRRGEQRRRKTFSRTFPRMSIVLSGGRGSGEDDKRYSTMICDRSAGEEVRSEIHYPGRGDQASLRRRKTSGKIRENFSRDAPCPEVTSRMAA
jgi:hypothetical protein